MRTLTAAALILFAAGPAIAQPLPHTEPAMLADKGPMAEFIRRYRTDRGDTSRFHGMAWSEQRMDRLAGVYAEWQRALEGVDDATLDTAGRIDWMLLRLHLENETAHLELSRRQLAEIDHLLPFRGPIQSLLAQTWRMEGVNPEHAAGDLSRIPAQIKALRERLEKGKKKEPAPEGTPPESAPIEVTPVVARRAASAVGAIREQLNEWGQFHSGYEPTFTWWTRKPLDEARTALDDYAKFLREDLAGQKGNDDDPLVGDPIGQAALLADLKAEFIPYSPQELIAIGDRELAWCEGELRRASAEMGLGDDWKAALARVKAAHVPPGQQDELSAEQNRFVIAWLKERDLVTVPPLCEETWRLRMITPQQQKTWPFAVYFGQAMGVSYPTDDMKHDDKLMSMRGNNRHFNRIVCPHELIPGHHLQGYVESRVRPYRQAFQTPFLVEGWALHWEMLLWDLNYPQTPEDRIGMLFWRLHRCARITVSLRFHLGEMTPAQMVDFLVDRVGHERFGATSEVRRYIAGDYSPLYQCGYMIGGLQVRALHRELVPARMTHRQFHDAVLREGPIPIELIRAALTDTPPTRDQAPAWRFADPLAP